DRRARSQAQGYSGGFLRERPALARQRSRQIEEGRPMIPQYRVFALAVAVAIGLLMLLIVRAGTAGLL
ncbi:hypothetical protein, partial [Sinorhizobium meliloti]|uniref:hypothetical protein n=1 Tax=Rhizobium meliloti TaxID=382 RepID=UPI001F3452AD